MDHIFIGDGESSHGLIETLADGVWTATRAPLPADAASDPSSLLGSVACPAADSCVAADWYYDSSGNFQRLIETLAGRVWTATRAPLPADADSSNPIVDLSVACAVAGSCVAVGGYYDSSGNSQGLIETQAG